MTDLRPWPFAKTNIRHLGVLGSVKNHSAVTYLYNDDKVKFTVDLPTNSELVFLEKDFFEVPYIVLDTKNDFIFIDYYNHKYTFSSSSNNATISYSKEFVLFNTLNSITIIQSDCSIRYYSDSHGISNIFVKNNETVFYEDELFMEEKSFSISDAKEIRWQNIPLDV